MYGTTSRDIFCNCDYRRYKWMLSIDTCWHWTNSPDTGTVYRISRSVLLTLVIEHFHLMLFTILPFHHVCTIVCLLICHTFILCHYPKVALVCVHISCSNTAIVYLYTYSYYCNGTSLFSIVYTCAHKVGYIFQLVPTTTLFTASISHGHLLFGVFTFCVNFVLLIGWLVVWMV